MAPDAEAGPAGLPGGDDSVEAAGRLTLDAAAAVGHRPPPQPVPLGRLPRTPRVVTVLGGLAVAVAAGIGLVNAAVTAGHRVDTLAAGPARAAATADNRYWDCLSTEVRSLVHPGEHVALVGPHTQTLAGGSLVNLVILVKVVAPVADVVNVFLPPRPGAYLSITAAPPGRPSCSGSVIIDETPRPHGRQAVRYGTGASSPGGQPPVEPVQ